MVAKYLIDSLTYSMTKDVGAILIPLIPTPDLFSMDRLSLRKLINEKPY